MYKNGDFLYYYVVSNNPTIDPRDIVTYEKISEHDLLIEYKNGNKEIFDTFANTRRSVVEESKKVSDEQTRVFFRKKLQMLMNRAWVNQSELASRVKTSQQMISRYLTGESIPNFITLKKLANALECSVEDFYEDRF